MNILRRENILKVLLKCLYQSTRRSTAETRLEIVKNKALISPGRKKQTEMKRGRQFSIVIYNRLVSNQMVMRDLSLKETS